MKIAFAGDWHGNIYWARQAIEFAAEEGGDIILHLGDFGYDFRPDFRSSIEASLKRNNLTLRFVDGNHEDFTWLYAKPIGVDGLREITPRVYHMPRGYRWEYDGVKFLAVGGAFSVDRQWRELGESWWAQETLTDEDIARASEGGPVDVLISHDCPSGVNIPGLERNAHNFPPSALAQSHEHRTRLRQIVEAVQPKSIWHGHYHIPYHGVVKFDYGTALVCGLDCDSGSVRSNVVTVDLADLRDPLILTTPRT